MLRLSLALGLLSRAEALLEPASEGVCREGPGVAARGAACLALSAKFRPGRSPIEDDGMDPLRALISRESEAAAQEYYRGVALPEAPEGGWEAAADAAEDERALELVSSHVAQGRAGASAPPDRSWSRSFSAGYADAKGKYVGGSEIVHLIPYEGKLYAANGYWMDDREGKSAAQVLRLDSPNGMWQQDLDTMVDAQLSKAPGAQFAYCLRLTALKALHVTTDSTGKKVDKKILLAACSAYLDMSGNTGVSIFVKTSSSGAWKNSYAVVSKTTSRKTPRAAELYVDRVTGIQRVFLLVGDFGILSGAYDSAVDDFVWDPQPETSTHGAFPVRALGIAESKNGLFFSVGKELWRRNDGTSPSWRKAKEVPEPETVNTEVGGIRGLSPEDKGKGMIFIWTPDGSSEGKIFNVSESMATQSETSLRKLYEGYAPVGGGSAAYSLGGYNNFFPVTDPKTGQTCLIFGFQQVVQGADPKLLWHGFFAGAPYGVRKGPGDYYVSEVGGPYEPGKPPLVGARTFAVSPFAGEEGVVYAGGFDANFKSSTNTAWIFKAGLNTVLGNTVSPIAPTSTAAPASNCGVCTGTSGILDPNRIAGTAHGFQYKCKDAEDFVKRNAATSGCTIPVPTWPTECCHGCNLCQGADNHLTPSAVAGMNAGKPFTCEELWRYMQSPSPAFTCAVAQASYGPKCCTKR